MEEDHIYACVISTTNRWMDAKCIYMYGSDLKRSSHQISLVLVQHAYMQAQLAHLGTNATSQPLHVLLLLPSGRWNPPGPLHLSITKEEWLSQEQTTSKKEKKINCASYQRGTISCTIFFFNLAEILRLTYEFVCSASRWLGRFFFHSFQEHKLGSSISSVPPCLQE